MKKTLTAEELRVNVKKILEEKGCTKISFPNKKESLVMVIFNKQSFFTDESIPKFYDWNHSGVIHNKDSALDYQYRIDYKKVK